MRTHATKIHCQAERILLNCKNLRSSTVGSIGKVCARGLSASRRLLVLLRPLLFVDPGGLQPSAENPPGVMPRDTSCSKTILCSRVASAALNAAVWFCVDMEDADASRGVLPPTATTPHPSR